MNQFEIEIDFDNNRHLIANENLFLMIEKDLNNKNPSSLCFEFLNLYLKAFKPLKI